MAMSSSLHRGYGHRLSTIRILLYSLCGTQSPEHALQHYGVLQITMGEPILHSMTHATYNSVTKIASSMYQTAMWSPILPFSVKTRPLGKSNVVLSIAQSAQKKQVRKRDGNEKKQKQKKGKGKREKGKKNSTCYIVHAAWPRTRSKSRPPMLPRLSPP